jgi:hypothetical protein
VVGCNSNSQQFRADKYRRISRRISLWTADQDKELPRDDKGDNLETRRSIIRQSLTEIASDIGARMRDDAGLSFPFGLTVPESGASHITMVTPGEPTDYDWAQAATIVCQIVAEKLGIGVRCRPLACVMVNPAMIAAEIVSNTLVFNTRL